MLLVGDDLENDYMAAHAAGWQAVLIDRSSTEIRIDNSSSQTAEIATISTLAQLPELCRPYS